MLSADYLYLNTSAHVMRSEDLRHINISWDLIDPVSLLTRVLVGYEVRYTKCVASDGACEDVQTVKITMKPGKTYYILRNVSLWVTYNVTIAVKARFNISLISGKRYRLPGHGPSLLVNANTTLTTTGILALHAYKLLTLLHA